MQAGCLGLLLINVIFCCSGTIISCIRGLFITVIVTVVVGLVAFGISIRFKQSGRVCAGDLSSEELLPDWGQPIEEKSPFSLNMGHAMKSYTLGLSVFFVSIVLVCIRACIFSCMMARSIASGELQYDPQKKEKIKTYA